MIVSASYVVAALAIYAAGLYVVFRLRPFLTASSMLLGFLLFVYGPAYLAYMLFRIPISVVDLRISNSLNFDNIVVSLNLSVTLMFICVIVGIELVNRLAPRSARVLQKAILRWNFQALSRERAKHWPLLIAVLALSLFMAWTSLREHHLSIVVGFLSVSGNEIVKTAYRQQYGGSQVYLYNVMVASIAPMMVVWGVLVGWTQRWWPLLAVTALLAITTVLGKVETLSKAPIALFLLQFMLVGYLSVRNNISWRMALAGVIITLIIFYPIIRLAVPEVTEMEVLNFFYYRAFDISNQSLLEYFAAYPERLPYMWGANIRPVAAIWGLQYTPSFDLVSRLWRFVGGSTTTAMFIADAWADFSYFGVVGFSIIVGMICRTIDIMFLVRGKTVVALTVLAATFIGIYNLMIAALPTSMLSGGLVICPLVVILLTEVQRFLNRLYAVHGISKTAC